MTDSTTYELWRIENREEGMAKIAKNRDTVKSALYRRRSSTDLNPALYESTR